MTRPSHTQCRERWRDAPLLFDGAMGTMLQAAGIAGVCNDELSLSRPALIAEIHRAYLAAGADIITTNSFGATRVVLSDHGLADRAAKINRAAAAIARKAADAVSTVARPRLVAGGIGPTSKLPTLGQIGFDELFPAYEEQMRALIEGGVDGLIIETCQDPLQAKAALAAARAAIAALGRELPVLISMTVEPGGTMLLGTELSAAMAAVAPYRPAAFGINCATGPEGMEEHLQFLSRESPFPILCQPNAGMPENVEGKPRYPLGAETFATVMGDYVRRFEIAFVGGCCGTTPDHIAALAKKIEGRRDGRTKGRLASAAARGRDFVASLYTSQALDQEPRPFLIAEQSNVNGSKRFRDLLLAGDFEAMADVAQQAGAAAHALDVCLAYAGRDERADLVELVRRVVLKANAAIMVDSTDPAALAAALARIPGRAIINSINLEDGGAKAKRILALARRFGAAVVALSIDERGMARHAAEKFDVAGRLAALAADEGLAIGDLLFDPLTFTLASGDAGLRTAARETLEAIRCIKRGMPGARTLLGVSNISFGLPAAGRRVLSSVFLHRALEAGLDAAIINPARIVPLHAIPEEELALCQRLIDGDGAGGDPLAALLAWLARQSEEEEPTLPIREGLSPEEALRLAIIDGSVGGLAELIDKALPRMSATKIMNGVLLPAMQEVGRRFGEGRLPLPFVLQSAETMRAAIDLLTPHLKAGEARNKGTIVLATVRGDVHDIGKNLVDAILANNGYRVINLGIRQPAQAIAEAAAAEGADAIGLSGLLVSSTEVMREDLALFRERGLAIPVLCGGAALTPSFVKDALAKAYSAKVYYCADAFAGLVAMEEIVTAREQGTGNGERGRRK